MLREGSEESVSDTADEKVLLQTLRMRSRRISAGNVQRQVMCGGRYWAAYRLETRLIFFAVGGRVDVTRGVHTSTFLHPAQSISVFLNGEDFARVLLDAAVALPDAAAFARILQGGTEVRGTLLAERLLEDVQLLAVPAGDGHGDLDGGVNVLDGSADTASESGAALEWS